MERSEDSTNDLNESTAEVQSQSTGTELKRSRGRPKGSKNSLTLLQEAMTHKTFEEVGKDWDKIVKATIKSAQEGDSTALKILWDRVIPAKKATDGSGTQGNSGVTIVVQGVEIKQPEIIDAEIIEESDHNE